MKEIKRVTVKTTDIIDPLVKYIENQLSLLDKTGSMREQGLMDYDEYRWLTRYIGLFGGHRRGTIVTPTNERCQELLDALKRLSDKNAAVE